MDRASPELVDCPHCRVKNFAIDDDCAACQQPLTVVILPRPKVRHFGLATVMVGVAVLAVCFACFRQSSGFGMAVSLIAVPAAFRTLLDYESRRADGRPMDRREMGQRAAESLSGSSVMLPLAGIFSLAAAAPLCTFLENNAMDPQGNRWLFQLADGLGTLIGIVGSILVARRLWPQKD